MALSENNWEIKKGREVVTRQGLGYDWGKPKGVGVERSGQDMEWKQTFTTQPHVCISHPMGVDREL